jgi:hypothetical protein
MTSNSPDASATIIPFPVGGRRNAGVRQNETVIPNTALGTQPVSEAASGSWYHEAAIAESQWFKKH